MKHAVNVNPITIPPAMNEILATHRNTPRAIK